MIDPKRRALFEHDRRRKLLRNSVRSDFDAARVDLHPRTIIDSWTTRQKRKVAASADALKAVARKNAPAIATGIAVILLFAARKPIWNFVSSLRDKLGDNEEDER